MADYFLHLCSGSVEPSSSPSFKNHRNSSPVGWDYFRPVSRHFLYIHRPCPRSFTHWDKKTKTLLSLAGWRLGSPPWTSSEWWGLPACRATGVVLASLTGPGGRNIKPSVQLVSPSTRLRFYLAQVQPGKFYLGQMQWLFHDVWPSFCRACFQVHLLQEESSSGLNISLSSSKPRRTCRN